MQSIFCCSCAFSTFIHRNERNLCKCVYLLHIYGLQWTDHFGDIIRISKFHVTICNLLPVFVTTEYREKNIITVHTLTKALRVSCVTPLLFLESPQLRIYQLLMCCWMRPEYGLNEGHCAPNLLCMLPVKSLDTPTHRREIKTEDIQTVKEHIWKYVVNRKVLNKPETIVKPSLEDHSCYLSSIH